MDPLSYPRGQFDQPIEIISRYTRAQAIEDGVLVDTTSIGPRFFKYPVAVTVALWGTIQDAANSGLGVTPSGILWDVYFMSQSSTATMEGSDSFYPVIVGTKTLRLRANCGPGDDGSPVMTIGYPEDF